MPFLGRTQREGDMGRVLHSELQLYGAERHHMIGNVVGIAGDNVNECCSALALLTGLSGSPNPPTRMITLAVYFPILLEVHSVFCELT